ncbi:MAG: MgtC/SapB family protein [Rhodospirillales bacterium]|nr:MAG: MgtC/SapB family protein [Rhodospirillales bacterium]
MDMPIDTIEMILRLGSAAVLAGIIGIDRELRRKTMGLRTFMLISTGTALFTLLGVELAIAYGDGVTGGAFVDPTRVLQGITAGIGLIAMGGVLHRDDRVRGATTGASVWVVGAIGAACGLGLYPHAATATAIAVGILVLLALAERVMHRRIRGE